MNASYVPTKRERLVRTVGLFAGPSAALLLYLLMPEYGVDAEGNVLRLGSAEGLEPTAARSVAAIALWMAIWWLTEALPIAATALLPIALFPLLAGLPIQTVTAPYANPLIFLFLGGFLIGAAMQRCELHKRFALHTVLVVGTNPRRMILGFMLATAFLSMWISNTATVVMMLPIGLSVIALLEGDKPPTAASVAANPFALALLLGIAYAASIGGVGTLIGTPPNAILASIMHEHHGVEITFAQWLLLGIPFVLVFLPLAWFLLTRWLFRVGAEPIAGSREAVREELDKLGKMRADEWRVLVVFLVVAGLWVIRGLLAGLIPETETAPAGWVLAALHETRDLLNLLGDPGIAVLGALLMFLLPSGRKDEQGTRLLDWEFAQSKTPWGVLVLFGGGLSLAAAMSASGLATLIGQSFAGLEIPMFLLLLLVAATVVFLTEVTSNTATTSALVPVLAAGAVFMDVHPLLFALAAALAASCAFMLPVATPPNAIVFSSGHLRIHQMARAGIWMNLVAIWLITHVVYYFASLALGVNLFAAP